MKSQALLTVRKLEAWYGRSHILQGIDLEIHAGEIVCIIGRNGAGKTTTMRSIMGLMDKTRGSVHFDGHSLLEMAPHRRYHLGLAYVFEERRIVPGLTVLENIRLGIIASRHRERERHIIDEIAETFPRLQERLSQTAATMSGGEQQMLAIARAMAADPKLIMLDEPSEGIMPVLVDEMFELFTRLKKAGKTLLLVEQNVELALSIADRAYIMDQGSMVHHAPAAELLKDQAIQERYCSV